jgi:hypothetical protein
MGFVRAVLTGQRLLSRLLFGRFSGGVKGFEGRQNPGRADNLAQAIDLLHLSAILISGQAVSCCFI